MLTRIDDQSFRPFHLFLLAALPLPIAYMLEKDGCRRRAPHLSIIKNERIGPMFSRLEIHEQKILLSSMSSICDRITIRNAVPVDLSSDRTTTDLSFKSIRGKETAAAPSTNMVT